MCFKIKLLCLKERNSKSYSYVYLEPRDKIQVISGPRQVGKSTLVKQVLQEMTVPHLLVSADVLQTKTIYKPALMKQMFELGCTYSSEELSLNKMLGQLQDAGNVTTLASYLSTLDESRLLCGLQKYASDDARNYNSVPKLMVYNTALFSAQSGTTFNKAFTTPKLWVRWVESTVGAYLLNQADEYDYKLYYWREREDEVDFIIEYNKQCIAIEVKSGRRTTKEGLGVFRDRFHPKQSFVVGSGGVPIEEFLRWDIGNLLE